MKTLSKITQAIFVTPFYLFGAYALIDILVSALDKLN